MYPKFDAQVMFVFIFLEPAPMGKYVNNNNALVWSVVAIRGPEMP